MRRTYQTVGVALLAAVVMTAAPTAPGQGFSPHAALKRMKVPPGFEVRLFAAEPMVRQPVAIEFDDRGRLWAVQYLQYPNPAGLKRVRVDRYSRTVYDRMPEPPPRGPRGADRITILEDTNGEGRASRAKDFVNGLNLATGIAFGHGGVFVLQAPYLLFYPDRNADDTPDGDPEVLLKGFGLEDASSVANSLTWGPDGWLYGCQGTTVTANIRGIEFQQGVWRYQPITRRFELFCEGGGNCWGLDFDRDGNLLYGTNYGGFVGMDGVQGAYYWKQFGKHGELHNPYAYGFFNHMPHRNFQGGHVTVGGLIYQGDSFPAKFRGKLIAGDTLGHAVYWHDIERAGSTFRTAHGGDLLQANDTWFASTDVTMGPDGSIFIADWYDKRTAHPDPDAEWDRSNGRIYQILARGTKPYAGQDLRKLSSEQLVTLLDNSNDWFVRKARRILADRRDPKIIFPLRQLVLESKNDHLALEALWALFVTGGFDEDFAIKTLTHRSPPVRSWTVRLLGDACQVSPGMGKRLADLAASEPDVTVRSQLACTARRLPAREALPIIQRILLRDLDGGDPYLPLLLWWAVERHAVDARDETLDFFTSQVAWKSSLVRQVILSRLIRRYAAAGNGPGYTACARLLASAPSAPDQQALIASLDQGVQDRPRVKHASSQAVHAEPIPPALHNQLLTLWSENSQESSLIRLMSRLGFTIARQRAVALATKRGANEATRLAMIQVLGDSGDGQYVGPLLSLLHSGEPELVQMAALESLGRFDRGDIASRLLQVYSRLSEPVRSRAREVLFRRQAWALAFLEAIDRGTYPARDVPAEQLGAVALYKDSRLDHLVRKHWGTIQAATPEEKLAEVRRLSNDLRAAAGDPTRGHALFKQHCGNCHRLFEEGERIGPDLTHANRKDRDYLLVSIVDPSAMIRKEYLSYNVQTLDGRLLTGLIVDQSANQITLVNAKNERLTLAKDKIEAIRESPVSLMPEKLLNELKPDQLRDLFSYLQADGAVK